MVDHNYDIQYINSEARHLFSIHSTALEHDLIHLIQRFESQAIRKAIDTASSSGMEAKMLLSASHVDNEVQQTLEITCMAIELSEDQSDALTLVTAIDVTEREQLKSLQTRADEMFGRLGKANEEVLAANQEMTVTITKLRADNEELLVASEEIQAATEEVETLNEELQASNEELETLNEELQSTVEELNTTNDDLQARTVELQTLASQGGTARLKLHRILDGINMAVAVVDKDGSILLKNDAYLQVFEHGGIEVELLDEAGLPLAENAPLRRAARGEEFHVNCGLKLPQGVAQYLVEGITVLPSTEDQAIVISFREIEANPDSN
jgi:two-component system CheB/CheR fusion protein